MEASQGSQCLFYLESDTLRSLPSSVQWLWAPTTPIAVNSKNQGLHFRPCLPTFTCPQSSLLTAKIRTNLARCCLSSIPSGLKAQYLSGSGPSVEWIWLLKYFPSVEKTFPPDLEYTLQGMLDKHLELLYLFFPSLAALCYQGGRKCYFGVGVYTIIIQ